ncbi:MAG: hypothetical protein PHU43_08680 [Candidatus Bipolaricaulis sp.]|nr:hypothetical protein [Candidatus Bipolaricaulis sp.]
MRRVVLVHWNEAEAEDRARELRRSDLDVVIHSDPRAHPRAVAAGSPDAVIIDLARIPSQGRELGAWLRRNASTRCTPIVFVEGDPEKTARVRALLPDATFVSSSDLLKTLANGALTPPRAPVVPGGMAAYAGSPLPKKLGIADGSRVVLSHAPQGFEDVLGSTRGATISRTASLGDIVVLFVESGAELTRRFDRAAHCVAEGGRLWIAWPKRSGGARSDLTQGAVRAHGLERGWVDYKIALIDATWSGLCFARRKGGRGDSLLGAG